MPEESLFVSTTAMMEPDDEVIKKVSELRKQALFLDAWKLLEPYARPEEWSQAKHRAVGARMIESMGGEKRGRKMWFRLWHDRRTRHVVREDMVWELLDMRGAFLAWQWLEKHPPMPEEEVAEHRDHPGVQAYLLAKLRDFERAEKLVDGLIVAHPESTWGWSVKADILELQDRREEALAAAEKALSIRSTHISSLHSQFDLLLAMGREPEALEKLRAGCARTQCPSLLRKLANLQIELGMHEEALATLNRHEELLPLMEEDMQRWQAGRRCDLASAMGDHAEALRQARLAAKPDSFYAKVAEYLEKTQGQQLTRRVLPVGFVAQHHLTCAPATVSAVARFLGKEVGHIELADEICYDGTPHYQERTWAEKHGWAVREFSVTVESAKQLIDRGIPIILSMVYSDSAHAQAVIGYDEYRQVLFVRDPSERTMTEFLALEALAGQAPFGPRGLAMVPVEQSHRFDGLELPEQALYDIKHAFDDALTRHDRAASLLLLEQMRRDHPQERLRWHVELALARYDDNTHARLEGLEALLQMHPKTINWQIDRLHVLRELRGREVFTEELRRACADKETHPLLWRMLGRELHWEARHVDEARRWIHRYHRARLDAYAVITSANMLWDVRRWEEASDLYRIASCLEDKNESFTMSYFKTSRWVRRSEEALRLLRGRFERDGHLSPQPAYSLAEALDMINRTEEAISVMDAAIQRRPDDMELALQHANWLLRTGKLERTREALARVKSRTAPGAWHRVDAQLASQEGDHHRELADWQQVILHEPQAADAHRAVARLLEQLESRTAALAHLRAACERFPFHWPLHDTWSDWVRGDSPEAMEAAARELLRIDPRSSSAWREVAISMKNRQRFTEAHEAMQHSAALDPMNPWHYHVLGGVFAAEKRLPEAKAAYRRAIALDADSADPMNALLHHCKTQPERLSELRYIQSEITRQVTNGSGVLEFASLAGHYLEPDEMERFLRLAHEQRPDLWQTAVTLAEHLREHDGVEQSITLMQATCERFPLMPRTWMELAECYGALPDRKRQIEAAMRVREINPGWGWGMRNLAEALKKDARYEEALDVMQQAVRHSPQDGRNHGWVAELAWHLGKKRLAVDHLKKAVEHEPGYGWAWGRLEEWGAEVGEKNAAREAAEALTRSRPNEARSWLTLADLMTQASEFPAQLATLDRAIAAAPHATRAYDEKARVLTLAGRFEEAFAVLESHPDQQRPADIIAREAWILWRKHDRSAAVARMRSALEADPAMVWGWKCLAEWYEAMKDLSGEEDAITHLSQIEPGDHIHLGLLGDVRERRGDTAGAIAAFERALAIAPDYGFALRKLFDHHCGKKDFATARKLLDDSRPHYAEIEYHSRLFLWHWRQGQSAESRAALLKMTEQEDAFDFSFNRVLDEVKLKKTRPELPIMRNELAKTIRDGKARNTHAAAFYVALTHLLGQVPRWNVLCHVPLGDEGSEQVIIRYVNKTVERWEEQEKASFGLLACWWEARRIDQLIRERREALQSNNEMWGTIGYALHTLKRHRQAVDWLQDWRERSHLEPYMLNNLLMSLQSLGRRDEAAAVLARGLDLPRHDDTTMRFHLYAALEDALAHSADSAQKHLDVVHEPELSAFSKRVLGLVRSLLDYQPGKPPKPFHQGAQTALSLFMDSNEDSRLGRDYATRACSLIGRHNHSWKPQIWLFYERQSRMLWLCGVILVVILSRLLR
ncbi:MAG: tetratricopeptide repeat protein [Verrucomicrobiaceae bacterium]|nr:tetratricopeptide repeat protein [Verrucomicrobiaceae bacterium]